MRNGALRHRVVSTDTPIVIGDDKGSASAAGLFGQGPTLESAIELGFATREIIQAVRCSKRLGRPER